MLSRGFRFFGLTALALGSALFVNGCRTKAPTNAYNGLLSSRDLIPPPFANIPAGSPAAANNQNDNYADNGGEADEDAFGNAPLSFVPASEAADVAGAPDKASVLENSAQPAAQAKQAPQASKQGGASVSPLAAVPPVSGKPAKSSASSTASKATPSDKTYTVAAGDTLGSIAKRYGVSWKDLQAVNNGIKPERLKIGQKLVLPNGSKDAPAASTGKGGKSSGAVDGVYTVVAGDSLWVIARRYKVTSDDLRAWNNLTSDSLKVGQKLKVRGDATIAEPTKKVPAKKDEAAAAPAAKDETPKVEIPANLLDEPVQNPVINTEEPPADILKQEAALKAEAQAAQDGQAAAEEVVNTPQANNALPFSLKSVEHQVIAGSTLASIAQSYACTVEDILKQNPQIKSDADLVPGSTIKIPYKD